MKYTIPLLLTAMALSLGACKKEENNPPPPPAPEAARVMFFNGCLSSGSLAVRLNDTLVPGAGSVTFPGRTGYFDVGPGAAQKVSFVLENSNVSLVNKNMDLNKDQSYTVFAGGVITNPVIAAGQDDLSDPGSGQARVRFVNLSPDDLNETAFVGSLHVGSDVKTGQMTPYILIPAGTANVIAQDPSNIPMSRTLEHNFVEGRVYSIVLTGTGTGTQEAALKLNVVQHN